MQRGDDLVAVEDGPVGQHHHSLVGHQVAVEGVAGPGAQRVPTGPLQLFEVVHALPG